MSGAVENTVWARAFVDELVRCGLRDVVVAPGSRSTPIVLACAARPEIRCRVHMDERSAGFFALGVGKVSGRPGAVVTTSGTAVANLMPAVVEATQASVPLLVLTADRPPRLRGADANQAIDQIRIFGSYPRAFHETAAASLDPRALRHHRGLACRAWASTMGADPGPVHVNLPFDKPLEPVPIPDEVGDADPLGVRGRADGRPFTSIASGRPTLLADRADETLLEDLDLSRVVVVAGPGAEPDRDGPAAVALATALGSPLLADGLSGARFAPGDAVAVAGYDLFLRDAEVRRELTPSAIVRIGRSPTSAGLQRWLFEHEAVPQVVLASGRRWKDHGATALLYRDADVEETVARVTARGSGTRSATDRATPEWAAKWARADAAVREVTGEGSTGSGHEGAILVAAAEAAAAAAAAGEGAAASTERVPAAGAADGRGTLVVSSSMPIRDLDAFVHPADRPLRVVANRGASGIDGVVSTAFGVAGATGEPVLCVIGDLAFFHDQNGLLWAREEDGPVVFVLIDNDGGGIFEMLPIADHEPDFTTFFATPHGLDFSHIAAQYDIPFGDADIEGLPAAIDAALTSGRTSVVRVRTDRTVNHRRRSEAAARVVNAVRQSLGLQTQGP